MAETLACKLSERMNCQILQNVDDKLEKVQELMKIEGLEWKEVAYLGETGTLRFSQAQFTSGINMHFRRTDHKWTTLSTGVNGV